MKKIILKLQNFADGDQGNVYNDSSLTMINTGNIASHYSGVDSSSPVYGLTAEMKEFYSKELIEEAGPQLIHAQFGDQVSLPKNHGSVIEWRRWGKYAKATTPITEGVTPAAATIEVTPIRKTLHEYGNWSMETDILTLTAVDNTIAEAVSRHSQNAALTLDTIVRNELIAGTDQRLYAGGAESIDQLGSNMGINEVALVSTLLKNNNAPKINNSYIGIAHPSVTHDLMKTQGWIDVSTYSAAEQIFNGEIGKLYGVKFMETTEAKVVKAPKVGTGTGATEKVKMSAYNTTTHTATIGSTVLAADDDLVGQKLLYCQKQSDGSVKAVEVTVADSTAAGTIVLSAEPSGITPTAAGGDFFASPLSAKGEDYFVTLVLGKGAYKVVRLDGNTAEIIVHTEGGTADPLNQRKTVGWVVRNFGAAVTIPEYIYKVYSTSSVKGVAAND